VKTRELFLGAGLPLNGKAGSPYRVPAEHLCTHGCIVGMTGSGKSGYLFVLAEAALLAGIPTVLIDVKGDLPNLLLNFPNFDPAATLPWLDGEGFTPEALQALAEKKAREREQNLLKWGLGAEDVQRFQERVAVRVITPGSTAGEPLHLLSSLERRSPAWDTNPDAAGASLSAAVSLVLRLVGRNADPAKSRDHVLLSVLAKRRHQAGLPAALEDLLEDIKSPPIERIGAQAVEEFMDEGDRRSLAAGLNTLLAAPSFANWRTGEGLDPREWTRPRNGKTPAVILSVAHLDDDERALVLGVVLEEIVAYARSLTGSNRLRALFLVDECAGLVPPHPANPPTKRSLVTLMKQGRAFGVGLVLATQNPMDLDYRALSNAGFWAVGRLQTDADRERIVESLINIHEPGCTPRELEDCIRKLNRRWFLTRNIHTTPSLTLVQPRWAMSFLRGPMTLGDIRQAREMYDAQRSPLTQTKQSGTHHV
jgi:Bacterial protein of unknown function (DUF853)